jgi:hypothetical protein
MRLDLKEQMECLMQAIQSNVFKLMAVISALFAPITGILATVALCIIFDTAIGIWKAKKLGERISSRKLSQVISKLLLYELTVMVFFLVDKFMLGDILQHFFSIEYLLTKVVGLVLTSVEIFSMDENYRAVRKYGLWFAFKKLVGRAKDVKEEMKDFDLNDFTNR